MSRRGVPAAALAAAVLVLLGACGLPSSTDPKYVGPAAPPNRAQDRPQNPPKPEGAGNLTELVVRYLKTSVGGNVTSADQPDAVSETQARMKTFMTDQTRLQWQPKSQQSLTVVNMTLDPQREIGLGKYTLTAHFTAMNTLDRDGQLVKPKVDDSFPAQFAFTAEQVGEQLLLSDVPDGMLLSMDGLEEWYQQQPIYFWERGVDAPKLVPDLRYMPRVLSASKQVGEVMQWLVDGPSEWLSAVVDTLPSEIETKDNPTLRSDESVEVNLSSKASGKNPDDLRRLVSQIRWSLPKHPKVSLSIESKGSGYNADGFANDNAAVVPGGLDEKKYVVLNGVVRPVGFSTDGPALFAPGGANASVVSAAINRAETKAALVRTVNAKTQQLFVSAADATAEKPPKYVDAGIPVVTGAKLSRPAWINRPAQRFLIADGTKLWAVTPPANPGDPAKAEPVLGPNDEPNTKVSAFAVSPDGRRIALVVEGNRTTVASLRLEGGKLRLGESQQVANSLGDNRAVGWLTETSLVIGGKPKLNTDTGLTYSLISTSTDGTGEEPQPVRGQFATSTFTITMLSVRTNDPLTSPQVLVVFEANQAARIVYADDTPPIPLGVAPSPSAGQTPGLPPIAPFFAD